MKIAYTSPAKDELYVIDKNAALRVVRALCPELPLLAFQTMHVPKMSPDIPYLVTFSSSYIRFMSIQPDFMSADLRAQFLSQVMLYICEAVTERRRTSYSWPAVIVAFNGLIYEIICSDGGLLPSYEEILRGIKKHPREICSYAAPAISEQSSGGHSAALRASP
jgi:hypothetical protein